MTTLYMKYDDGKSSTEDHSGWYRERLQELHGETTKWFICFTVPPPVFFDYPHVVLLRETACISKVGTVLMASRLQAFRHRTTCGLLQHWGKEEKREKTTMRVRGEMGGGI